MLLIEDLDGALKHEAFRLMNDIASDEEPWEVDTWGDDKCAFPFAVLRASGLIQVVESVHRKFPGEKPQKMWSATANGIEFAVRNFPAATCDLYVEAISGRG